MNKLKIMKSINKFLYEFYPSHPDDIVIKNDYYPRGIKEVNIYNYYLSIKDKLINWIDGKRVAFLLRLSPKQTVLIRNQKGKPIHLTSHNFEDIITGRTNVIYVTEDGLVNNWVIDIDAGENINIIHVQKVLDILQHELIPNNIDSLGIKKTEAILTSPQGIHLIGYLNHATNIDILRNQLSNELQRVSNLINPKSKIKFTVNEKGRPKNTINFDLSSMYENSLHIAKYSLTKEFLICNDVDQGLKRIKI